MEISTEFAYILGVLYGDGYIAIPYGRRGSWRGIIHHVFGLQAKDKEFVQFFVECLNKEFNLNLQAKPFIKKYKEKRFQYFQVNLYSKKIVQFILGIKEEAFASLINSAEEIICSFLKGLWDSGGSVSYRKHKYCRSIKLMMKEDDVFFKYISELLKAIGISSFRYYLLKNNGKLIEIGTKQDLLTFQKKIGFTIFRKQESMKRIVDSYNTKMALTVDSKEKPKAWSLTPAGIELIEKQGRTALQVGL